MQIVGTSKAADTLTFSLDTDISDGGTGLSIDSGTSAWGVPPKAKKSGLNGHRHNGHNGYAVPARPPVAHPVLRDFEEYQTRAQRDLEASVAIHPEPESLVSLKSGGSLGPLWDADSAQVWNRTRVDWVNPQSHVAVAAIASLVYVAPIYYTLFKYVQKPDAGVLDVLIASFVVNTLVGAIPGGIHWEYVRTRLESTRATLASWSNRMELDRIFPTLAHSNGIPDYMRFNDQAKMALMLVKLATELGPYLLEIILDKDIKAALAEEGFLSERERKLVKDAEGDLRAGQEIVAEVGSVRRQMGIEKGKAEEDVNNDMVINSLTGTALASGVATLGAMVYLFGPPEASANTDAVLTVFTLQYLFGSTINHYFMQLVHMNLWDFKIRPLLVQMQNKLGVRLSPSLADEMGQPENFRARSIYDSLRVSTTVFGRILEVLCLRLEAKKDRTSEENERLSRWRALLDETKPVLKAINHRLDAIDAVDKARK